jgi:hypothetical protein
VTDASHTSSDWAAFESDLRSLVAEAVDVLEIAPEIDRIAPTLFEQVEACDDFAARNIDAAFLPTSLPLTNALIHYAAPLDALSEAREWSRERWPDERDPTKMLAVLTLIYIIEKGTKEFAGDPQRHKKWQRMHDRIAAILQQAEPSVAAVA